MSVVNGYRCVACAGTQPAEFGGYLCPHCGGNLDINYDYAGAVSRIDDEGFGVNTDGMFGFAPLLPVECTGSFPLKVGATPLYPATRLGRSLGLNRLYFKDETVNPSASTKDRASAVVLRRALELDVTTVATASTGNAASSMACMAAGLGLHAVVFVPEKVPAAKLAQLLCFGAQVLAVRGNYDAAFDLCLEACAEFGWYNRSTGLNPFTREGKKTCSYEIWEDLGRQAPDWIVVPTGDGNLASGIWKGWRDLRAAGLVDRLPRIVCAQSENSAAISLTSRRVVESGESGDWSRVVLAEVNASTVADSISVDRPRDGLAAVRAVVESSGLAVTVSDEEILQAIPEIARSTGLFLEPSAAVSWAAVRHLVQNQQVGDNDRVICLASGSGLKDIPSAQRAAGAPLVIDPDIQSLRRALAGRQ